MLPGQCSVSGACRGLLYLLRVNTKFSSMSVLAHITPTFRVLVPGLLLELFLLPALVPLVLVEAVLGGLSLLLLLLLWLFLR
jgi:hypothetical protein